MVQALSLLKLPESVQDQVEQGGLAPSVAHEIAKLRDPGEQVRLAEATVTQGLTHKDVTARVRKPARSKAKAKAAQVPAVGVLRIQGYRIEVSRKAGVAPDALESVISAALDQVRVARAGIDPADPGAA